VTFLDRDPKYRYFTNKIDAELRKEFGDASAISTYQRLKPQPN
jgi:hypothetical protein